MLSELQVEEFILIGAATEGSIRATALGLLSRLKNVTIVKDAIGSHVGKKGEVIFRQMLVRGAKIISTNELIGFQCTELVRNLKLIPIAGHYQMQTG